MAGRGDEVAYAANWRTVLLVDALFGAIPAVFGLVMAVTGRPWLGLFLVVAGAAYVTLVARRALRWRRLRADAGIS